jgi:hypothetical protein
MPQTARRTRAGRSPGDGKKLRRLPDALPGSRDISRLRLAAAGHQVRQAGEQLHAALARALELPYPVPEALELAVLADQVLARAGGLDLARESAGVGFTPVRNVAPAANEPS